MRLQPIDRRDWLWIGSLAALGGAARSHGNPLLAGQNGAAPLTQFGVAKRCIVVWLDGGPSHLEMFDPKPDASAEVRGPLSVIRTALPGIVFGEGLPRLAQRLGQYSVIRSMTSPVGEHNLATQYALTGHIPGGRAPAPAFLLPVGINRQPKGGLPVHVAVPNFALGGGFGLQGFLPATALPWSIDADPADRAFDQKLWPRSAQVDLASLERRRKLIEHSPVAAGVDQAIELLRRTDAQRAFDLDQESPSTRERYGARSIGQSCLLARRLIESGVSLVTVNNQGWDTHDRLHERLHSGYTGARVPVGLVPSMDQAVAALLDDLTSSGMIDDTLLVVMGEFGRTPKINTQGGRDHWPRAYSVMLAGAGIGRGVVYGRSNAVGEMPDEAPVTPSDLVATLYCLLGIEPFQRVATPDGQSFVRVPEQSQLVTGVLA